MCVFGGGAHLDKCVINLRKTGYAKVSAASSAVLAEWGRAEGRVCGRLGWWGGATLLDEDPTRKEMANLREIVCVSEQV
jgi:hypothetical protein